VELFKKKKIETEEDVNEQTIHETGGGAAMTKMLCEGINWRDYSALHPSIFCRRI
jgi:hypothetical protein